MSSDELQRILQAAKATLWIAVYAAVVQQAYDDKKAAERADLAVQEFEKRRCFNVC